MSNFFKKLFSRSIKDQLILMVMIITIVISVLMCISFLAIDIYRSHSLLEKELIIVSQVVEERLVKALEEKDKLKVDDSLEILILKDKMNKACVYNSDGELVSFYSTDPINLFCKKNISMSSGNSISRYFFNNKCYEMDRLILSEKGTLLGKLIISANLQDIYDNIIKYIVSIILIVIPIVLFAYFLASKISYFLVSRIKVLLEIARAVKKGDYSARANLERFDEIGDFAETFDLMIKEIGSLTYNLENIVESKTNDLKTALNKANYMQEIAEKASNLKNEWICNIGHEIRTPVHAILAYSSFGFDEIENNLLEADKLKKYFSCIKKSSFRLSELIEGLLDFGKLEAGKSGFNFCENDLPELINDLLSEFENSIKSKNLDVVINNFCSKRIYFFDKKSIGQVLSNLINNAIKFSPEETKIEITLKENLTVLDENNEVKEVFVSVRDSGVGVPEDEFKDIFDTFTQSSNTKTGAGGTGLGLSISRKIIESHKGRIWCEPVEGKGALFVFSLPV